MLSLIHILALFVNGPRKRNKFLVNRIFFNGVHISCHCVNRPDNPLGQAVCQQEAGKQDDCRQPDEQRQS